MVQRSLSGWLVPILLKPLHNNTTVLQYAGSREATAGNIYQYLVADMTASILCAILHPPYTFHKDIAERDAWIARQEW